MIIAFERATPAQLRQVLETTPVAYVPLGSLEFHGWHLPLGFDGLKVAELCKLLAGRTGGAVLPPLFAGFAGGHAAYEGSIMIDETTFTTILRRTFTRLVEMGFKVIVALTGHYPEEQMNAVADMAAEFTEQYEDVTAIGLAEAQAIPNEFRGDHAAKWETSLAMALLPDLVTMDTLANYPDPLYGICGEDPREHASRELGRKTADRIVAELEKRVQAALDNRA